MYRILDPEKYKMSQFPVPETLMMCKKNYSHGLNEQNKREQFTRNISILYYICALYYAGCSLD